ncbi:MAG TPA: hypothetical protein DCX54_06185 [Flavobacteriales bacterium]|nr:hypothetical protein [Flavobacteriales bacterium]
MKILSTLTLLSLIIHVNVTMAQKSETKYNLSSSESSIKWMCKDANSEFSGSIKLKSGHITMKDDELLSAVIYVDAKSINCSKCGSEKQARELTDYMKSTLFLNTENMDYAVFKMYESKKLENSNSGNHMVKGNMTIIAFSNEMSFPVFVEVKKGKLAIEGSLSMNRDLWNLKNPVKEDGVSYSMDSKVLLNFTLRSE